MAFSLGTTKVVSECAVLSRGFLHMHGDVQSYHRICWENIESVSEPCVRFLQSAPCNQLSISAAHATRSHNSAVDLRVVQLEAVLGQLRCEVYPPLYIAQMAFGDLQQGGWGPCDIQPTSHMCILYIAYMAFGDLQQGGFLWHKNCLNHKMAALP